MTEKKNPEEDAALELRASLDRFRADIRTKASYYKSQGNPDTLPADDLFVNGPPVSPMEFINSPEFFGDDKKQIVFPWVKETLQEVFSGEYYSPKYQTVVCIAGKGSGKSYLAGFAMAYLWYWYLSFKNFRLYMLSKGIRFDDQTTLTLMGMAPNARQAKEVVFNYVGKIVSQVKCVRDNKWMPDNKRTSELCYDAVDPLSGRMFSKLQVVPGNSSQTFSLGYNIFAGVIDEACFWKNRHYDPAKDIYDEMHRRQHSRFQNNGVIFLISSANVDGDFVEEFEVMAKTDPSIYFKRRSLYDCRPEYKDEPRFDLHVKRERADGSMEEITLHPPLKLKPEYDKNRNVALKDIDNIPTVAGSPFYPDYMFLMSRVNRERPDPCPDLGSDKVEEPPDVWARLPPWFMGIEGCEYGIHIDLAKGNAVKGHCGCGFAMSHKQADPQRGFRIILDIALRFKTPKNTELKVSDVLSFVRMLKEERNFNITKVTFDKWNSLQPKQTLNEWNIGILADELSVGYKEHMYMKNLLNTGQCDIYHDSNLLFEMKRLEDYGDSIDHAAGAYKDEVDAVAGSFYLVSGALDATTKSVKAIPPRVHSGIICHKGGNSMGSTPRPAKEGYRTNPKLGGYRGGTGL